MLDTQDIERITAPLANAFSLPPAAYTAPQVFEAETRSIFYAQWICVGREEQLARAGDYRLVHVVDQPIVVVRTSEDTLCAHSAVCPHRSMPIVEASGHAESFSCPYHLWKFNLDGTFVSAPYMDRTANFPNEACNLAKIALETWQGFIFVNLNPNAASLTSRMTELSQIVANYNMAAMRVVASEDFECPWNWKILLENFMEAYHHIGPHRTSVQPINPAKDSYVTANAEAGWALLHMPNAPAADESPASALPTLPNLTGAQKSEILAGAISPTFCWLNTPSIAFWYELMPSSHNRMKLTIHTLVPENLVNVEGLGDALQAFINDIHLEDITVNRGPWLGLHAPLAKAGRLSHLEEAIWQLNQWWVAQLYPAASSRSR